MRRKIEITPKKTEIKTTPIRKNPTIECVPLLVFLLSIECLERFSVHNLVIQQVEKNNVVLNV